MARTDFLENTSTTRSPVTSSIYFTNPARQQLINRTKLTASEFPRCTCRLFHPSRKADGQRKGNSSQ